MKFKPFSVFFLSLEGFLLMGMGVYFVFLRPSLLPEDAWYMGSSLSTIQTDVPGLAAWLQKVFWVLGGYIFTTGLLTFYVARTSFRTKAPGVFILVLVAGINSIGAMVLVNFMLQSDFRWVLGAMTIPWFMALLLYLFHK
ncbi:MAG: hypothetical protein LH609_23545 [Rudanella sp.]|nr:hypothetical protein [Rudanella sp.]